MPSHVAGERVAGESKFVHRRHCRYPERQATPGWALVGDLRNEVGVDVANSDPAQRRIAWVKIAGRGTHAKQGQIVENGIGRKDADVATDFDGTPRWRADGPEDLTEIHARRTERERGARTVGVNNIRLNVITADIDAEIGADIPTVLIGA